MIYFCSSLDCKISNYRLSKLLPFLAIYSLSEVAQSCLTLCDPMDSSLPGSAVHGIFQARILEWAAISFSKGSSQPRIEPGSAALQTDALPSEPKKQLLLKSHTKSNLRVEPNFSIVCTLYLYSIVCISLYIIS